MKTANNFFFLRNLIYWINDHVGDGDGTQYIRAIWKDEPELVEHFVAKWNKCVEDCSHVTHEDPHCSNWPTQQLALLQFLMCLSEDNLQIFIDYIIINGRW